MHVMIRNPFERCFNLHRFCFFTRAFRVLPLTPLPPSLPPTCACGQVKKEGGKWEGFHPVLSLLSYMLKAPLVPPGTPVVNALFAQRQVTSENGRVGLGGGEENCTDTRFRWWSLYIYIYI